MSDSPNCYEFGPFFVNTAEGVLSCRGESVALPPKAFETLVALVENCGHVVSKERLMQRVWRDSFVEENNLSQNISLLRKTLQQGGLECAKYIETVPKRGYRFNAEVIVQDDARSARKKYEKSKDTAEELIDRAALHARSERLNLYGQTPALPASFKLAISALTNEPSTDEFDHDLLRIPETRYGEAAT